MISVPALTSLTVCVFRLLFPGQGVGTSGSFRSKWVTLPSLFLELLLDWKQNADEIIIKLNLGSGALKAEDVDAAFTDTDCVVKLPGMEIEQLLQAFLHWDLAQLWAKHGVAAGRHQTFTSEAMPCCQLAQPQAADRADRRAI